MLNVPSPKPAPVYHGGGDDPFPKRNKNLAAQEAYDIRAEQRKNQYKLDEEKHQESRLRKVIGDLYNNPEYKNANLETRQSLLWQTIAPVDQQLADRIQSADIQKYKAQNPTGKAAVPGNVPVPPEISAGIETVLNSNKNSKADDLAQAFDKAGVPRVFSNPYVETRRRQDETNAKNEQKQLNATHAEKLKFHEESAVYDAELLKKTQVAKRQVEAIDEIEKRLAKGNVKPNSAANMFKGMGKIGDKISKALENEDQAAINASIPQLLEGWKDIFGVRLSDADLKILEDKLPSIAKSTDANKAVLKILRKYADMTLLRGQIANDILKQNNDLRPLGYARKVEERFDEMIKSVEVINPNNGRKIEIPAYQLKAALDKGAKLANE